MSWKFIKPNKPISAGVDFISELDDCYLVQAKIDGWRLLIHKTHDGDIRIYSRHNQPVALLPSEIVSQLRNTLPCGCEIDCEWINPVRIKAINSEKSTHIFTDINRIVVFDMRWFQNKFLNAMPLERRWNLLLKYVSGSIDFSKPLTEIPMISLVPHALGNKAREFYDMVIDHPLCEGIVAKRLSGNMRSTWYKVKSG